MSAVSEMKLEAICSGCGVTYERTPQQAAQYRHCCPACNRLRQKKWRDARKAAGVPFSSTRMPPEYHRAYRAEHYANPEAKDHLKRSRKAAMQTPAGKAKQAAREAARAAIRSGKLLKEPCRDCGAPAEAHHPDYSRPLLVIWLCHKHHLAEHVKMRRAALSTEGRDNGI